MPNHVVNHLTFEGDPKRVAELLDKIKNDEYGVGTIDFNKVKPMPPALKIEAGSRTDKGLKAYRDFVHVYTLAGTREDADLEHIPEDAERAFLRQRTDIAPDEWALGKQAFRNDREYGSPTWYEWSIAHWGTKWNAYGYEAGTDYGGNDGIYMQTAWSAPHPIVAELARQNPDIRMTHSWADEELGYGCGQHEYFGGKRVGEYYPTSNKESIDFACAQWDTDPSDWGYTLNASGNGYITTSVEEFEPVEIFGRPALFTPERMTADEIPQGMYCYHLRETDTGDGFASIEHDVRVNFGGTLITREPLDFKGLDHIPLDDDTAPDFIGGEDISFDQFFRGDGSSDMTEDDAGQEMVCNGC